MDKLILDGHKLQWHENRVTAWMSGERIAPITIDCSLTRACTYRCIYCYGQLQANDEKRMTRDVVYRFLDDAADIGVKAISFVSDGESTCSPHLYDAILRGHENDLDIALGTNGYLLKDDRLEDILPALTYLRFNVSAGNPEDYASIHGCPPSYFDKVCETVKRCVNIKHQKGLDVTLGLQMVLLPEFRRHIPPLVDLGKRLEVDYLVIKHCSDDEQGSLGVDYSKYENMVDDLKQAESCSDSHYLVKAKWSKILSQGKRRYRQCYGPPLITQFSGSGLVAPCGMLFSRKYKRFHIDNIVDNSFKNIWKSERYWEVMNLIASERFNAQKECGTLCLQHKVNEFLWDIKQGRGVFKSGIGRPPMHVNFI